METVNLIAGLLREVKYRLKLEPDSDIGFSLIMGLAIIAASARHTGLADEVRILSCDVAPNFYPADGDSDGWF